MTGDESTTRTGPSRRRVLRSGAIAATGAIVGGAHTVGAETRAQQDESTPTVRGAMYPYHFAPGSQATIVETDLGWLPERLPAEYRTHVIEYGRAQSFRGFLFAHADDATETTDDASSDSVSAGQPVSLERTGAVPGPADATLLGVEAAVEE